MNVAILHYHLNRGGVTRVIENQLLALDAVLKPGETLPVALIYGGRRVGWPEDLSERLHSIRLTLHVVPQIDYDEHHASALSHSGTLGEQLSEVLDQLDFTPCQTVIHGHNHSIGKNVCLPRAAWLLAERGYAMLLQVHDFVEDFRPANFRWFSQALAGDDPTDPWHGRLYPQAPHVHYAVLNGRDREILACAGAEGERLHLLPNPVPHPGALPPREGARQRLEERFGVPRGDRLLLYPVRGIRRKNVGEALLYSKLAPPGTVVGLTLPPLSPSEQPVYARWKQLSAELKLPCRFGLGTEGGLSFTENLAASDLILTTSVAEGFGMVYLESWLAGRGLVGRDLPEITSDFRKAGVRLDGLQPRLRIPIQWVAEDEFRQTVLEAYRLTLAAYARAQPMNLSNALDAKMTDGLVDFGDLDEPHQERVIERVCRSDADRRQVLECNPWIDGTFAGATDHVSKLIRENVEAIGRHFSLTASGRRLLELYGRVLASRRGGSTTPLKQAERIFDWFLDLERFRLIRTDVTMPAPDENGY